MRGLQKWVNSFLWVPLVTDNKEGAKNKSVHTIVWELITREGLSWSKLKTSSIWRVTWKFDLGQLQKNVSVFVSFTWVINSKRFPTST